jgi:hypothetical protein
MTSSLDPNTKRAGDPSDHEAALKELRDALGMGAVRSPLPVNIDEITNEHPVSQPDPDAQGPSLEEAIAHEHPPVPTHLVEGARDEHAHHVEHHDLEE